MDETKDLIFAELKRRGEFNDPDKQAVAHELMRRGEISPSPDFVKQRAAEQVKTFAPLAEKWGISGAAAPVFERVNQALADMGVQPRFTSGKRNNPSIRSPHNTGEAVDFVVDGGDHEQVAANLRAQGFRAQAERKGQVNANGSVATGNHIHITLKGRNKPVQPAQGIALADVTGLPEMAAQTVAGKKQLAQAKAQPRQVPGFMEPIQPKGVEPNIVKGMFPGLEKTAQGRGVKAGLAELAIGAGDMQNIILGAAMGPAMLTATGRAALTALGASQMGPGVKEAIDAGDWGKAAVRAAAILLPAAPELIGGLRAGKVLATAGRDIGEAAAGMKPTRQDIAAFKQGKPAKPAPVAEADVAAAVARFNAKKAAQQAPAPAPVPRAGVETQAVKAGTVPPLSKGKTQPKPVVSAKDEKANVRGFTPTQEEFLADKLAEHAKATIDDNEAWGKTRVTIKVPDDGQFEVTGSEANVMHKALTGKDLPGVLGKHTEGVKRYTGQPSESRMPSGLKRPSLLAGVTKKPLADVLKQGEVTPAPSRPAEPTAAPAQPKPAADDVPVTNESLLPEVRKYVSDKEFAGVKTVLNKFYDKRLTDDEAWLEIANLARKGFTGAVNDPYSAVQGKLNIDNLRLKISSSKPAEPAPAPAKAKPEAAVPPVKQPWESIPTPSQAKIHHYGTVEVDGEIAYKLGGYPPGSEAKAQKAGYRQVGGGKSYRYWTRGEPKKYTSPQDAVKHSTEFELTPTDAGARLTLYSKKGLIHSSERQIADVDAARRDLIKLGLKDRTAGQVPIEAPKPAAQKTVPISPKPAASAVDPAAIGKAHEWAMTVKREELAATAAQNIYAKLQAKKPWGLADHPDVPAPVAKEIAASLRKEMAKTEASTTVTAKLDAAAEAASQRLRERSKKRGLQSGVDPQDLADATTILLARGGAKLIRTAGDAERIVSEMAAEYGEWSRPAFQAAVAGMQPKVTTPPPATPVEAPKPAPAPAKAAQKGSAPKPAEKAVKLPPRPVEEATGLANQVQTREAEANILREVEPTKGKSPEQWQRIGKEIYDKGTSPDADFEGLAHRVARGTVELTGERVGVLLEGKRQLLNDVNAKRQTLSAHPGDRAAQIAYEDAQTRLDDYLTAVQAGKGRWSDVGRALQAGTELDTGNFAEVLAEAKRTGATVSERQLEALTSQVAERDARIADLEKKVTTLQADRAVQRINREVRKAKSIGDIRQRREFWKSRLLKTTKMQAGVDPEQARAVYEIAKTFVEEGAVEFNDVVARVSEELEWKREDVINALASRMSVYKTPTELQRQMQELKSQAGAETKIADLKRQLATREFDIPTPREREISERVANLRAERNFWSAKVKQAIRPPEPHLAFWARVVASIVRGVKLGSDIGVLFRQGFFGWARVLKGNADVVRVTNAAFKNAFTERAMMRHEMKMLEEKAPDGRLMSAVEKKAGLGLTDHLTAPEENVLGQYLAKLPVVGPVLDRFQYIFINDLRRAMFRPAVKAGQTMEELTERARFINNATGRGNLRHVPAIMEIIMTSPRYEASRWGMIEEYVKSPVTAVRAFKNPAARANVTDLAAAAGLVYLTYKGAELAGYKVEWDPSSGDFLKMRRGNEVWDVSAGLAPRIRDVLRLIIWGTDPRYGKNIGSVAGGMVIRPISPAVRTPVEQGAMLLQRQRGVPASKVKSPFTGYPPDVGEQGWQVWSPLIFNTFYQTVTQEHSVPRAVEATFKEFIGTSISRYPPKKAKE